MIGELDNTVSPHVSIIVRAYNEGKHIGNLLDSCFRQKTTFSFEVILVDSGSDDDTVSIAKRYPVVVSYIEKSQFSFGRALNLGISRARGAICVIVSAHCVPMDETWLANIVRPFEDPLIGLVYGRQRGDHRSQYSELQIFMQWFPSESIESTEFAFCNNANSAIRKSIWMNEPFNEELTGLEDLDWAKRIVKNGYRLSYRADAGVVHIHEENFSQVERRYFREALAYREIYPHHRFSFFQFVTYFLLNAVSDIAHSIRDGRFLRELLPIVRFRFHQFYATYKAHHFSSALRAEMHRRLYYPRSPKDLMKPRSYSQKVGRDGVLTD